MSASPPTWRTASVLSWPTVADEETLRKLVGRAVELGRRTA